MSLEITLLTLTFIAVGGLLSFILSTFGGKTGHSLILVLALFSGSGVLLAMGSIEMAGRYGYSTLLALFAFTMVFVFSPLIFYPIRRLNGIIRLASVADFLTFRFRGKSVAVVVCSAFVLATVPLFIAQLRALTSVSSFLFGDEKLLLLVAIFTIIVVFNWRSIEANLVTSLRWIMAAAGLLLLVALALSALVSVNAIFGGINDMNTWVIDSGQRFIVQRMDSSYSLFVIFLAASFALPVNFTIVISEYISNKQSGMTAWAYPLLMLLASIPIFPLLWSGIAVQSASPLQDYLFALPAITGHPAVAALGAASIILVAIALLCSLSTMLAKMVLNSFVLPTKKLQEQPQLSRWINSRLLIISSGLLLACALLDALVKNTSITDLYLIGFAGLAQLTPGMLAAIYIPTANRRGFIVGLVGGMLIWLVTLALPLFFGDWSGHVPGTSIHVTTGMQSWDVWAFEALMVNILLCTLFSIFGSMNREEKLFARLCMVDNIYIPARVELAQASVAEMTESLRRALGTEADVEIEHALSALDLTHSETRPAALRKIRDHINSSLNMRLGILATYRIMEKCIPLTTTSHQEPDDIYMIESVVAIHSDRLTGIASELNKLRIHHREILDNLPIGLIAIGQSGAILKWNSTMATYTGIDAESASGVLVGSLPEPWGSQLNQFASGAERAIENLRIDIDGETRWFNLQKSVDQATDNDAIILIEDNSKSVLLTQNYINNERLASVGRLAAGVAHEIGNPVTGIACLAQNLQHETDASEIEKSAELILSQTNRINLIVQSLINFSRGDRSYENALELVNVREIAEQAIQLLQLSNQHASQQFVCHVSPELEIVSDRHQLVQVFLNLLSNARDASPEHSEVTISAERSDSRITIMVSDAGTGIPDDIQARIFEPFVTSKEPGDGTGLGLWIVFHLVKALGGEINLSSPAVNSDRGTTARLHFAVVDQHPAHQ